MGFFFLLRECCRLIAYRGRKVLCSREMVTFTGTDVIRDGFMQEHTDALIVRFVVVAMLETGCQATMYTLG